MPGTALKVYVGGWWWWVLKVNLVIDFDDSLAMVEPNNSWCHGACPQDGGGGCGVDGLLLLVVYFNLVVLDTKSLNFARLEIINF